MDINFSKTTKIILIGVILCLISFSIGFIVGLEAAIHKGTGLAVAMMDSGHLNISYDKELIDTIMRRYVNSAKLT